MQSGEQCPCGTGERYDDCCGPLLAGGRQAATAEELMRSRYSAYVVGDSEYVWRTWHPRTRPADVNDLTVTWTRLDIVDRVAGMVGDSTGEVEFRAHHRHGVLHERSRFETRANRWFYLDGDLFD